MTLKETVVLDLLNMSDDIRMGCACGNFFSPKEMAIEVATDTKEGKEFLEMRKLWEDNKHLYV